MTLSIGDDGSLPTEFRIFRAGENTSTKGTVLFNEEAAAAVMAAYEKHGAELPLDLEHLSTDPEARNFNSDAMAWFRLELRRDERGASELWAVDVRWTDEGARRLRGRLQRYISPAFWTNKKGVVVEVLNVALTSLPASDGLQPLIAASRTGSGAKRRNAPMADDAASEVDIAKVAEGMGLDLAGMAKMLGLDANASLEDFAAKLKALSDKIAAVAGLSTPPAPAEGDASAEPSAASATADEEKKELTALRASVLRETGASTAMQALSQIATWRASHLKLEAEQKKLAQERAALELAERKELSAKLVKLGKETPHTSGLAYGKLAKHLAEMPLVELRDRVAAFERIGGSSAATPPATSATGAAPMGGGGAPARTFNVRGQVIELTERELQICAETKNADGTPLDPAVYAASKAIHLNARRSREAKN